MGPNVSSAEEVDVSTPLVTKHIEKNSADQPQSLDRGEGQRDRNAQGSTRESLSEVLLRKNSVEVHTDRRSTTRALSLAQFEISQARYGAAAAEMAMMAFQAQAERLAAQNQALEERHHQLEEQVRGLEAQNSALGARNTELEGSFRFLAEREALGQFRMAEQWNERERLQVENARIHAENGRLCAENTRMREENSRLQEENGWAQTREGYHTHELRVLSVTNHILERDKGRLVDSLARIAQVHGDRLPLAREQMNLLKEAFARLSTAASAPVTQEKTGLRIPRYIPRMAKILTRM
ncbi:hypothetical protein C8R43DRAFT_962954 [Mycena crocata]|nr:hypothetical protein C8R43DRAFT_962954 [Mycena crocata]